MQKAFSLDSESLRKIGVGALLAGTGGAALYILNALGAMEVSNPVLASFLVWFVPFATNLVKEYVKGE